MWVVGCVGLYYWYVVGRWLSVFMLCGLVLIIS